MEDAIILEPNNTAQAADASVIWLHGLGADANDFLGLVDEMQLSSNVRFIFPNAPKRAITVNGGMIMRAWYDIASLQIIQAEDQAGILSSQKIIESFIADEMENGILPERIIVGGFSQGGAMALYAGLRCSVKLGGIIGLSAYMPVMKQFDLERSQANHKTPIMMAHGLFDPVVPLFLGKKTEDYLKNLQYIVEFHAYPMQHTVIAEEIMALQQFINKVL